MDASRSASSPVKAAPPLSLTAAINLIEARIGPTELRRRAWHMLPGLLPFILVAVPHDDPTSLRFKIVISSIAAIIVAAMCYHFSKIRRRGEQRYDGIAAVVGYALPVLALILMFPAHAELALTVLTVIAFGDGSATLGGLLFRGRSLPWNSRKSWFGTACFVAVGLPYAMAIYWAGAHFSAHGWSDGPGDIGRRLRLRLGGNGCRGTGRVVPLSHERQPPGDSRRLDRPVFGASAAGRLAVSRRVFACGRS